MSIPINYLFDLNVYGMLYVIYTSYFYKITQTEQVHANKYC